MKLDSKSRKNGKSTRYDLLDDENHPNHGHSLSTSQRWSLRLGPCGPSYRLSTAVFDVQIMVLKFPLWNPTVKFLFWIRPVSNNSEWIWCEQFQNHSGYVLLELNIKLNKQQKSSSPDAKQTIKLFISYKFGFILVHIPEYTKKWFLQGP